MLVQVGSFSGRQFNSSLKSSEGYGLAMRREKTATSDFGTSAKVNHDSSSYCGGRIQSLERPPE